MKIRFENGYNGKSDITKGKQQIHNEIFKIKKNHNNTNLISPSKKNFYIDSIGPGNIPQDNPICQKTDIPRDETTTTHHLFQRLFKAIELRNDVSEQSCSIIDGMWHILCAS